MADQETADAAEDIKEELSDDLYSYRKYGAKGPTQTRSSTRHYFKCNHEGCPAKKVVEIEPNKPQKVEMMDVHNHPPDAPGKNLKRKSREYTEDSDAVTGGLASQQPARKSLPYVHQRAEQTKSKRASAQGVRDVVQMVLKGHSHLDDAHTPTPPPTLKPKPQKLAPRSVPTPALRPYHDSETSLRQSLEAPAIMHTATAYGRQSNYPGMDHDCGISNSLNHVKLDTGLEDKVTRRMQHRADLHQNRGHDASAQMLGHASAAGPSCPPQQPHTAGQLEGHEGVHLSDPRLSIKEYSPANGQLALLFTGIEKEYKDDYAWRKYGKKEIKGCSRSCPRFYWRCTNRSCDIKRHTQATDEGQTEVHYYGAHNHVPPPAKAPSKRHVNRVSTALKLPVEGLETNMDWNEDSPRNWGPEVDNEAHAGPYYRNAARASDAGVQHRSDHSGVDNDANSIGSDAGHTDNSSIATSSLKPATGRGRHQPAQTSRVFQGGGVHPDDNVHVQQQGQGRCPLFFLACVAAKEPWV